MPKVTIEFSLHSEEKLHLLEGRGFLVTKDQVVDCLQKPDRIDGGYKGRKIAQKKFDEHHVLRVVFEISGNIQRVVTLYPGKRDRYEN